MEKRRLISLRSVLLQYLVRTALACLLVAVGWLLVLMLWIQNGGLFLPANQAAQACQKAAQDVLPGMTAATFDETQLDSLCRYALFAAPDSSEVLATNMDAGHLQRAMENRQGKTRWHFGYTQYYMTSKLQDGTVCLLQFDYAVPYADPALRGVLPDMQTVHCILGILLLVGAVVWSTHRTGRFLTRETEKLTAAAQAVARKELDSAVFSGAKVREYESALQALQTMGDALTGSLQKQWVHGAAAAGADFAAFPQAENAVDHRGGQRGAAGRGCPDAGTAGAGAGHSGRCGADPHLSGQDPCRSADATEIQNEKE